MSECLHMLQPSLLSGPERFALGGGRSGPFCIISELCVATLQHCGSESARSVHADNACTWCLNMSLVDSSMEPAALLACINPPLFETSSFICKLWPICGLTVHDASRMRTHVWIDMSQRARQKRPGWSAPAHRKNTPGPARQVDTDAVILYMMNCQQVG
jgi:hypothetical protein